jgi:hypothetical protein
MQNTQIISQLIARGIFRQFPSDYEFNEEILVHILEQQTEINPDDVNLQALADMLNNYYSDKLFHDQGISEDPNGVSPTTGYMVSLAETERKLPEYSLCTLYEIETACREYHQTIQPNTYFGAWIDEDILYLDNSVNIQSLDIAIAFGHANKQIAIWDIANGKSIRLD